MSRTSTIIDVARAAVELIIALLGKSNDTHVVAARAAAESLKKGLEGKVSSEAVLLEIDVLRDAIRNNDVAALKNLRARFPQSEDVATGRVVVVPGDASQDDVETQPGVEPVGLDDPRDTSEET